MSDATLGSIVNSILFLIYVDHTPDVIEKTTTNVGRLHETIQLNHKAKGLSSPVKTPAWCKVWLLKN